MIASQEVAAVNKLGEDAEEELVVGEAGEGLAIEDCSKDLEIVCEVFVFAIGWPLYRKLCRWPQN